MTYYKVTGKNGEPCNGGSGKYHLPTKCKDGTWKPGKWMPEIVGELKLCVNGYHLCRPQDLLMWLNEEIYEAEYRGEMIEGDDKVVVKQVRLLRKVETWDEKIAREFACWCVRNTPVGDDKTVWDLLEDERSKNAVIVAENLARGKATKEELAAARAAAWAAARAAAGYAAWDSVWDAAWDSAWDSAWDAAWDAAKEIQQKHLLEILGENNEKT